MGRMGDWDGDWDRDGNCCRLLVCRIARGRFPARADPARPARRDQLGEISSASPTTTTMLSLTSSSVNGRVPVISRISFEAANLFHPTEEADFNARF